MLSLFGQLLDKRLIAGRGPSVLSCLLGRKRWQWVAAGGGGGGGGGDCGRKATEGTGNALNNFNRMLNVRALVAVAAIVAAAAVAVAVAVATALVVVFPVVVIVGVGNL